MQKHPQHDTGNQPSEHQPESSMRNLGSILRNVQLPWLMQRYPHIPVFALCNFLSGFLSIGLMAEVAVILHTPFIFPWYQLLPDLSDKP